MPVSGQRAAKLIDGFENTHRVSPKSRSPAHRPGFLGFGFDSFGSGGFLAVRFTAALKAASD
jgi:hypothetical protein